MYHRISIAIQPVVKGGGESVLRSDVEIGASLRRRRRSAICARPTFLLKDICSLHRLRFALAAAFFSLTSFFALYSRFGAEQAVPECAAEQISSSDSRVEGRQLLRRPQSWLYPLLFAPSSLPPCRTLGRRGRHPSSQSADRMGRAPCPRVHCWRGRGSSSRGSSSRGSSSRGSSSSGWHAL